MLWEGGKTKILIRYLVISHRKQGELIPKYPFFPISEQFWIRDAKWFIILLYNSMHSCSLYPGRNPFWGWKICLNFICQIIGETFCTIFTRDIWEKIHFMKNVHVDIFLTTLLLQNCTGETNKKWWYKLFELFRRLFAHQRFDSG